MSDETFKVADRRGQFSRMPARLLLSSISDRAVRLYGIMDALFINRGGSDPSCWPSRDKLVEITGQSMRTIDRSLAELVEVGAIEVKKVKTSEWPHNVYVFVDNYVQSVDRSGKQSPDLSESVDRSDALSRIIDPENDSRPSPSAPDLELIASLAARKKEIALAAVDGEPWAVELVAIATEILEQQDRQEPGQPRRMIDRPADERFDTSLLSYRLCARFVEKMTIAIPDTTAKISRAWVTEADRMLRIDKRDPEEVAKVISWIFTNPAGNFWVANCQSVPKFRRQYQQIRHQMVASAAPAQRPTRASTLPPPVVSTAPVRHDASGRENPDFEAQHAAWLESVRAEVEAEGQ